MNDFNVTRRSKIKDITRNKATKEELDMQLETSDFLFTYDDSDTLQNEIAEWYTYSEEPEFLWNLRAFEKSFKEHHVSKWKELSVNEKKQHIIRLLNLCEISNKDVRSDIYRSILYLAQGSFGECETFDDYNSNLISNVILLYECDVFNTFVELLYYEVEISCNLNVEHPKTAPCITDNCELRVILSVLYTIIEVIRNLPDNNDEFKKIKATLKSELNSSSNKNSELFSVYLFQLVSRFCNQNMAILPIKKILLLLWKVLLFTLGGLNDAFKLKNAYREKCGLPIITENPTDVINKMPPATPPPNPVDLVNDIQNAVSSNGKRSKKNTIDSILSGLTKQQRGIDNDEFPNTFDPNESYSVPISNEDEVYPMNMRPKTPEINLILPFANTRSLPWKPKVKECELELFLDQVRKKFLGYGNLQNDNETLIGLPYPIHESVKILKQHLYVSLAECQIKSDEKYLKYPLSQVEQVEDTPAERLYKELLPNLPSYLVCLLKILLASIPQMRPKADSLQIMSDLFPEDLQSSQLFNTKLAIDSSRHKEILIKSISSILLLMLKHFKVNHVYQFEFMAQHLLFANCAPLILKFFNTNISVLIYSKNYNSYCEFPNCVIGHQGEMSLQLFLNDPGDTSAYCWRNVFSMINLLRVLNKLIKNKKSRVMMLAIFKSSPILKKFLKVKQIMIQYYALKLLKAQTKYLGRQWRKSNMTTMSAIYQKIRHRFNDDWVYGNEPEPQPWEFQADEASLRTKIDRFNQRRYKPEEPLNPEYVSGHNSMESCLDKECDLPDDFENNYEEWLNNEIFSNQIDWDALLQKNTLVLC